MTTPAEPASRRRGPLPDGWWPWGLFILGLCIAAVTPALAAGAYGADLTWPALVTSFASTFFAFLIALAWDRRQRDVADRKQALAEARQEEAERRAEVERRRVEVGRRLGAIALELERIEASLRRTVAEQHRYKHFFPDFPTGSWRASAAPLGLIVANYGLMADLATFYGQVEEVQWRLRFKAYAAVDETELSPLVDGLARQLLEDVRGLRADVQRQIEEPDVEPVPAGPPSQRVVGRRQLTSAIRVVDLLPTPAAGEPPS